MKIKTPILILSVCAAIALQALLPAAESVFSRKHTAVIIDPGHGLPDGGAVADDGTPEAELNLIISELLFQKLTDAGISCLMTRTDENGIHTGGKTVHQKKVSDIRNRVSIANAAPDALLISIHMNTFPSSTVHGTHVFYKSASDRSKNIAYELQSMINLKFQPNNHKLAKPISQSLYLFSHTQNDSVLIECGFLTNAEELLRLKDTEFQQQLAEAVAEVIIYKLTGDELNAD